ncbi:sigma-70 family RNA polymerase sigma factor [Denitrobaculum tricleocarpae]|nr:sigma-70 family RNA polymerase sigma factor [Denitrobaculum tricleocarpae]
MMQVKASFKESLVGAIPNLRAFAVTLTGNVDRADDLVQETLVKAWSKSDSYEEGTHLHAWLFTILRNTFYSEFRKRKREVEDTDGSIVAKLSSHAEQTGKMDLVDFKAALTQLPPDQREALILVGASGFTCEEASVICGCAVGTIKSRVNRARAKLTQILDVESGDDFGPDPTAQAILSTNLSDAKAV